MSNVMSLLTCCHFLGERHLAWMQVSLLFIATSKWFPVPFFLSYYFRASLQIVLNVILVYSKEHIYNKIIVEGT